MTETLDYVQAVLRRAREPMEPFGFEPDWADKPWRHKVYEGVPRLPLPVPPRSPGTVAGLLDPPGPAAGAFTLPALSEMLLDSYGLLARRLALTGNEDSHVLPWLAYANLGRGTASGGGLYPVEVYWVAGAGGPVPPGVYHYASQQHALDRLLSGDVTARVRAALGDIPGDAAGDAAGFLLLSVKFWKNAFKYNTFCYHVVSTDIGTLLGTWNLWARANGLPLRPALWFDEPDLDELLGLPAGQESVFAVVPLHWEGSPAPAPAAAPLGRAAVSRAETERSATVIRFDRIERVQAEAARVVPRPAPGARAAAAPTMPHRDRSVSLPAPDPGALDVGLATAVRARRSSFGGFAADPPLTAGELSGVLALAAAGARMPTDVTDDTGGPPLTRLAVFVNHVTGVPPGVYDHDPATGRLAVVEQAPVGWFLQQNYFLNNYNLEQTAAAVAVLGRPAAAVAALGDRGYRALNAEVGAVAQATYTAAAALGVGCGAVFGFDNVALQERLAPAADDEWPLLLILLGHERRGVPEIDQRLV